MPLYKNMSACDCPEETVSHDEWSTMNASVKACVFVCACHPKDHLLYVFLFPFLLYVCQSSSSICIIVLEYKFIRCLRYLLAVADLCSWRKHCYSLFSTFSFDLNVLSLTSIQKHRTFVLIIHIAKCMYPPLL